MIVQCNVTIHVSMKTKSKMDVPEDYFKMHFLCLRILGFGTYAQPKLDVPAKNCSGHFQNSNFTLKYVISVTVPSVVFLIILIPTLELSQLFEVILAHDYEAMLRGLPFGPVHVLAIIKYTIFYLRSDSLKKVAYDLEVSTKQFYQNYDMVISTVRLSRTVLLCFLIIVILTTLSGASIARYGGGILTSESTHLLEYENDTSEHLRLYQKLPYVVLVPWETKSYTGFVAALILQIWAIAVSGIVIGTTDMFIATIMLHFATQFQILQESMVNLSERAFERTAEKEGLKLAQHLKGNIDIFLKNEGFKRLFDTEMRLLLGEWVKHHKLILGCVETLEATYTIGFFTQLITSVMSLCIAFCAFATLDPFTFPFLLIFCYSIGMLMQLFVQCYAANKVTIQKRSMTAKMRVMVFPAFADVVGAGFLGFRCGDVRLSSSRAWSHEVCTAIHCSAWYRSAPVLRRDLAFIAMRAQRHVKLTALNFVPLSLHTFVAILRMSYSYFTVLGR